MSNYCETCDIKDCQLRGLINFCEDCMDYNTCTICSSDGCKKGHDIECNNGFEPEEEEEEERE